MKSKGTEKMDIVFLTNLYPKENDKEVRSKMSVDMNDAANALQWNLVNGIDAQCGGKLTLVNRLPVFSFPKHYPEAFIKSFSFAHKEGADDINPGFCNITGIKQFTGKRPFIRQVMKRLKNNSESVILIYSLHPLFLETAKRVKKKYPKAKIYAIVADLPQFSANLKGIVGKAFQKNGVSRVYSLLSHVDGFILLTEQMADKLGIKVPHIVMEGIAPTRAVTPKKENENGKIKLLYTGSMNLQYGICVLLEAFSATSNDALELHLCGLGNAEDTVKEYAKKDKRIIFHGKVPHAEVLKLQSEADILINPRQNTEEFTKYSFPSKNLEYLSSGKPLVAYKLDGIPDEYDDYIIYPENNTPKELVKVLERLAAMTPSERKDIGDRAKKFIDREKNYIAQTGRILEFMKGNSQTGG